MNKQIRALLLSVLMILNVLVTAVPALAAGGEPNVAFTVSVTEAQRGDTVTVEFSNKAMTVTAFTAGILFDREKLECISIVSSDPEYPDDFGLTATSGKNPWKEIGASTVAQANVESTVPGYGAVGFVWNSADGSTNTSFIESLIATITFKVKDTATAGDANIIIYESTDGTDAYENQAGFETRKVNITVPHVCAPTEVEAKEADCENAGNKAYYECECGKYFEDADAVTEITDKDSVVIPKLGHDWDEGAVTTEPTETEKGVKTFTCKNDNSHTKTEEIPELGHQCKLHLTEVETKEADCENAGNIAYYVCECGKYYEDAEAAKEITDKASVVIPETGHDWDEGAVTTEPTENEKGVKTFTCKNDASHTKTEEIPELGHQCKLHLTEVEAKEADCENAGNIAYYVCECGKYYADSEAEAELSEEDVIIEAGHAWSEWTETTAPTCTDKGEETRICTKECGVEPETREVPALGHDWGNWVTTIEPTTDAKGEERRDCSRCDAFETREIEALEDDSFWDEWYWTMIMLQNQIFEIEADASEGGEITPDGVTKVRFSRDAKYTITPDEGYEIEAVYVDGVDVGAVDTYTFKRVVKDHTIYAVFAEVEEEIEAPAIEESLYDDVDADDWFYDDVAYVTENGLMNGTGDDLFSPEVNTTRAMIVTILWRLEGETEAESAGFTDVADDMWYTEAIDWAAANGIVNGFGDGTFGPEKDITREQVMAILHRYAAYKGWDDGLAVSMIVQYDCSVWAENDVNWADMNGILADLGVDVYDMTAEADRAEIAAYFTRFCLNVAE